MKSVAARDAFASRVCTPAQLPADDLDPMQTAVEVAHPRGVAQRPEGGHKRLGLGTGLEVCGTVAVHDMPHVDGRLDVHIPVQHRHQGLGDIADDAAAAG